MNNFYLLAAQLPLLQGIGADVLLEWETEHVLRPVAVESDEGTLIGQGEVCHTLMFLAEGSLERTIQTEHWTLTETLHAPAVIEEEALWSLRRTYRCSYRSNGEATLLVASKDHVMRTMMRNEIFRMNVLMRLSTRLERSEQSSKGSNGLNGRQSPEDKITAFIRGISTTPSYPKTLKIKMTTLATILQERRITISNTLHSMQDKDTVGLKRETIIFK